MTRAWPLEVDGLTTCLQRGDDRPVVADHVSFSVDYGETFALVGESGCGKSVTALSIMRLLSGGLSTVAGTVHLAGQEILSLPEHEMRGIRGNRIAMIFQEPSTSLNPVMAVGDQVAEVLARHRAMGRRAALDRVAELFDAVGIADAGRRLAQFPFQLSGGLRQRVMIAMALACEPAVLIADEPTTALDVTIQAQVLDLLQELQRRTGMAMLLITHDLAVVTRLASRVGVMYAGAVVEQAPGADFARVAAHPYTRRLIAALPNLESRGRSLATIPGNPPAVGTISEGCRFADRCDDALPICRTSMPPARHPRPDHVVICRLPLDGRAPLARGEPVSASSCRDAVSTRGSGQADALLEVSGLRVQFQLPRRQLLGARPVVRAVDGVDLRVERGRTVALVGESGCGKSTVARSVMRLVDVDAGRIVFDGVDITRLSRSALQRHRRGFQMIFQDPFASLNPRMRVRNILEEGVMALSPGETTSGTGRIIEALLPQVGLDGDILDRYPHEFSGGQRQRIAIARALAVRPRLLICDEPTSALDVSVQAQILNLMSELQARQGLAYLFITHNMAVVQHLAHEVLVMYLGRVVERGPASEVMSTPAHPYTRGLVASIPQITSVAVDSSVHRIEGDLPSVTTPPSGCHFHTRCPVAMPGCAHQYPPETEISPGHGVRCFLYGKG